MKLKIFITTFIILINLWGFVETVNAHSQQGATVIHMTSKGYEPSKVEIKAREKVVFENTDSVDLWPASNIHPTHQIYAEFDPKKPIKPNQVWEFKFNKKGTWRFHDHLYPQIVGSIQVLEDGQNQIQNQGLVGKLWVFLKQFFTNLFKKEELVNVEKDSEEIFHDDKKLYSYIKKFGPKQATGRLYELTSKFGDCHQRAHEAGRLSFEIYKEKAFQQCGAECHSGCYHGATEAYFRQHGTGNLAADLNVICSSELNPFFSHQCIHGVGHGLMAWTDYDIFEALNSCNLLTQRQNSCWTGVFMENIVGGLAEGHSTKYLNNDPNYPCTIVDEQYKAACYFLQTSRMIQLFNGDFAKIAQSCLKVPQAYQRTCFESMGRDVGGVTRGEPQKAIKECSNAQAGEFRIGCLVGAVQDSFWDPAGADDAITFCKLLTKKEEKDACYNMIFVRAKEIITDKLDVETFCQKMEQNFKQSCLNLTLN